MRMILHVSLPIEPFNSHVRDGSVGERLGRILEAIKPEAAYFCAKDGNRGGFIVVDVKSPSDMPRLAEPWFLMFNATVEFLPAMTPEDLKNADVDAIGKKWK